MKIKYFLLVTLVLLSAHSYSQSFHIGITGGADLYKLQGEGFSSQFSYGYFAGAFAEVGLNNKWSIEPAVLFNQSNPDTTNKFSAIYNGSADFSKIELHYFTVPVFVDYKLSKFVALQLGPQFGLLINQTENISKNVKDAFQQGDMDAVGGIQLRLTNFRIYGRYVLGVKNINNINENQWTNQEIQLGIGYCIL